MSAVAAPSLPVEAWDAWRAARTERLVRLLWRPLQRLGEANKAGLLVEAGACGGELAVAMSARLAWRDLLALEPRGDLLARGAARRAADPALHRLDFLRAALDPPRLPLYDATVSGIYALGALARAGDPAALLAEWARVLRPGGALLAAEPVGGLLAGLPRPLRTAPGRWANLAAGDEWRIVARERRGGFLLLLAHRAGGPAAPADGAATPSPPA